MHTPTRELLLQFISNFQNMLILIRVFQKYYALSSDLLLKSAVFAFLSKIKPYSTSYRETSFRKYQKICIKHISFAFIW